MERLSPELEELAEQIGEFIQYWGFKKVHGRIWLHLFASERPLDAADIIHRLRISKALVSMSLKDLLEYEVICDLGRGPRGTQLYGANPDVIGVILSVLRRREKRILSRVFSAYRNVRDLSPEIKKNAGIHPERLQGLGKMVESAEGALEAILSLSKVDLEHWRAFTPEMKSLN